MNNDDTWTFSHDHAVQHDPSYVLKHGIKDYERKFLDLGMNPKQAEAAAYKLDVDKLPEMYENLDEWVEGKPLSDVVVGRYGYSLKEFIETSRHYVDDVPLMCDAVSIFALYVKDKVDPFQFIFVE